MIPNNEVQAMIEVGLPGAAVKVDGDGYHYEAVVVSADFEGLNTMGRHRLVYATLGEKMGREIHALSLKTHTPNEIGEKE
jgi:acid stress-induced BolA-like protein IbaG/YrbA